MLVFQKVSRQKLTLSAIRIKKKKCKGSLKHMISIYFFAYFESSAGASVLSSADSFKGGIFQSPHCLGCR